MSMELTLFGGLILVILLFALGRAYRLPAEMAGLLAAGLPLLAFFVYLFGRWPGLDVVAIHIALFISAAFVLVVFSRYRSRQKRMHWVPKALIVFFAVLAVLNAGFLYVATKGLPASVAGLLLPAGNHEAIHTGFAGTTRHGQEAAKAIGADLSREHRNTLLGWNVRVEGLRQPAVGENTVIVSVEDGRGVPLPGLKGELSLARPGGIPKTYPFSPTGRGQYKSRLNFEGPGLWVLELHIAQGETPYRQSWEITLP
jgi:nitrogen fixation protein FixH